MTTDDFNLLLRSIEGQFQINLAPSWAKESDQGGVQRMLADDAITVTNVRFEEDPHGRVNSNSNNKTLSTICEYITCQGIEQLCIDSFVPFGHCCPICGTRIWLAAMDLEIQKAKAVVFEVLIELETESKVFATVERTAIGEMQSEYEIVLCSSHNVPFDEDFHKTASSRILERLTVTKKTNRLQTVFKATIFSSKIDRTIQTLSKVVACLIYFSILAALVGMYAYQNVELRVSRQNPFTPIVKYRRQADDVAIEMEEAMEDIQSDSTLEGDTQMLISSVETPEIANSEDIEDLRNVNPNFELDHIEEDGGIVAGEEYEMTATEKFDQCEVLVDKTSIANLISVERPENKLVPKILKF
ncbi:Protein amnionless [Caenorhabditis elegans]|nr:Protein amnionless [Caenorhabditis elegans]CTQ86986.1 Protein amnionless [Caenorhabditis elegans]|eukprot:NP_001300287.1 Uncharacterized protein CELE_Y75B7AL.2 [Caenorhabditis elegans]